MRRGRKPRQPSHLKLIEKRGQLRFFKPPEDPIGNVPLEVRVKEEEAISVLNLLPFYGFSKGALSPFLFKIRLPSGVLVNDEENGIALEKALVGMNNFESLDGLYGMPHSALIRMNTPEILAAYIGVQQRKVDKYVPAYSERFNSLVTLTKENFPQAISKLVQLGYSYRGIRSMAELKKGFSGHSTEDGALIQRMQDVPRDDREKFVRSLLLKWRDFGYKTDELRREFRDPFEKNDRRYDNTGKIIWIGEVVYFMQCVYSCNVKTAGKSA